MRNGKPFYWYLRLIKDKDFIYHAFQSFTSALKLVLRLHTATSHSTAVYWAKKKSYNDEQLELMNNDQAGPSNDYSKEVWLTKFLIAYLT